MNEDPRPENRLVKQTVGDSLAAAAERFEWKQALSSRGSVVRVGDAVAFATGMTDVAFEELVEFDGGSLGMAYDLDEQQIGIVILTRPETVCEGQGVRSLRRLPDLPAGPALFGRIVNALGLPVDEGPEIRFAERMPVFRSAPEIIERKPVDESLWTGVMAIDAAIPIGRGQRELIIGDRNTGKTALALDIVAAQQRGDVACVYVVIGQPMSRVLTLRDNLQQAGAWDNTIIVAADAAASPGMQYLAPYAGASIAEWFREQGQHALVIFDDLTKHADAYRELALLLDRPPGREAYPGDIFYVHSELLERAAARPPDLGGGSVTALPLIETTEGDISSYIPTNLISITDGQIYLDAARFEKNLRPAVDIGRSVSRIGSKAQSPAMKQAAKNLRIQISRFESLESLTRVGLEMDSAMNQAVQQGNVVRGLLCQSRFSPRDTLQQVIALTAVRENWFVDIPVQNRQDFLLRLVQRLRHEQQEIAQQLIAGELPKPGWIQTVKSVSESVKSFLLESKLDLDQAANAIESAQATQLERRHEA